MKHDIEQYTRVEFDVDPKNAVFIYRQFCGKTKLDKEIENLPIPNDRPWLQLIILLIRYYQKNLSQRLGNRCVFDPSCSHYAELAFRKKGMLQGVKLTIGRLFRCRPANGGLDDIK